MDSYMESMLGVYIFEANELLTQLDDILLRCEKDNSFGSESINEIFRIMHTIKGSSAMMEFNSLATISHKIEDMFQHVRKNGLKADYNDEIFELVLESSDFLKEEIARIEKGEPLTINIGTLEQKINGFVQKITNQISVMQSDTIKVDNITNNNATSVENNINNDEYCHALRVFFTEEAQMENLRALMLISDVNNVYSDIKYEPSDIETNPQSAEVIIRNGFLIIFRKEEGLNKTVSVIENFVYTKNYIVEQLIPQIKEIDIQSQANEPISQNSQAQGHSMNKQSLINVNLSKLDSLMDLTGEIVITESMITASSVGQTSSDNNFAKASRQLRKLTDALQENVISIRMVPISGVFQKMSRVVRDMGKKMGKDVELVLYGEDTEVDKTIVDAISDPIMHLVRNSMDHGIEEKSERSATTKPKTAKIILSAQNTCGEVVISIEDDGRGIDTRAVLDKAKRQGLLKKVETEYSPKEIFSFLLMPGFSTNKVVTEYSGRGVGMDVVQKNVSKIGGDVSITSEFGKGTKTLFKIPLTLAVMNGMKVSVGGIAFTIPINNIRQMLKVFKTSIISDGDSNEIVMIGKKSYPLIRLHKVYELANSKTQIEDGIILLVENNEKTFCIFVDSLLGEQQVVVKPIPVFLNQYHIKDHGIAGCAILGDGSISLIMDIYNLYSLSEY